MKRLDELKRKSDLLESELKASEAKRGRSISPMFIHSRVGDPVIELTPIRASRSPMGVMPSFTPRPFGGLMAPPIEQLHR